MRCSGSLYQPYFLVNLLYNRALVIYVAVDVVWVQLGGFFFDAAVFFYCLGVPTQIIAEGQMATEFR